MIMNRIKFIGIADGTIIAAVATSGRSINAATTKSIAIGENIQFILRSGYLKGYPPPVSLRRPVDWFMRQ
jgi:hypothetical protein